MTTTAYSKIITVSESLRIEKMLASGNFYPQRLVTMRGQAQWAYWHTGNQQRRFKTEAGARKFLAAQKEA